MKITIDTKEDSHEDIRKIVELLSQLLGEKAATNAPERELQEESGNLLAEMFGQAAGKGTKTAEATEEDDEDVKVIPY